MYTVFPLARGAKTYGSERERETKKRKTIRSEMNLNKHTQHIAQAHSIPVNNE